MPTKHPTENALIPELSVIDWETSRRFYCDVLGFSARYDRPEEGFSFLGLGAAKLMVDQIGVGRDFQDAQPPFGAGMNLQIMV